MSLNYVYIVKIKYLFCSVFKNPFHLKMATVFDSPFIRQRLHRLRHRDFDLDEDQRFGRCDCTSYSYFVLSMVLFSVGTVITVLALGDADGYILSNLGHMWLVGPIFICSGMMVAVKSMLYLRRKSVIQMLLHQRAIIRVSNEQIFPTYLNFSIVVICNIMFFKISFCGS